MWLCVWGGGAPSIASGPLPSLPFLPPPGGPQDVGLGQEAAPVYPTKKSSLPTGRLDAAPYLAKRGVIFCTYSLLVSRSRRAAGTFPGRM